MMPARAPRIDLTCEHCGGPFQRKASEMKHKPVRFCSQACKYASFRRGTEKACHVCGRSFYSAAASGNIEFCSRDCYLADARQDAHSYPKIGERHAHRVIMERELGRPLGPADIVHHLDEDKMNFAAEMKVDLAAIERNNRDAIAALPENHRADVIEAYDKAGMRFGHGS